MNTQNILLAIRGTQPDPTRRGRLFTVIFRKRTDGTMRQLRGRLGMRKNLKGIGANYSPEDHGLIRVWEANNGYRTVPLDAITSLRVPDGHKHLREVL